ncbi:hypothetical protein FOA52_007283 [Chlamydomonas sp. UWO 241]|nr:hypothetical protein FOA52_007283 [Chlamydomonas sp. UWO 241]
MIYEKIQKYLDVLIEVMKPTNMVVIAVDGVAPQAKMAQQRTRRFLSARVGALTERTEAEIRRKMQGEAGGGLELPTIQRFDSNVITPRTAFMVCGWVWTGISHCLREWARARAEADSAGCKLKIVVSDASEPGEGEHKVRV